MTICAVVQWKRAIENGKLYSFVLRCLNEPSIYSGITIPYLVHFWTDIVDFKCLNGVVRKTFQLQTASLPNP